VDNTTGDFIVGHSHKSILLQNSPLSQGLQERARVFNLPVFSRAKLTKMVCKCSLVERLDLLPMAVLLMIGGKLPAKTGKIHSLGRAFTMVVNVLPSEQVWPSNVSTCPPI